MFKPSELALKYDRVIFEDKTYHDALLKFGNVSKSYLMRKLKCSESTACSIIDRNVR